MDTAGHDAPSLSVVLVLLLLHADDLIILSTTAAGLQRQLDDYNSSVFKGNSVLIWPRPKWSHLVQKLHDKLSC